MKVSGAMVIPKQNRAAEGPGKIRPRNSDHFHHPDNHGKKLVVVPTSIRRMAETRNKLAMIRPKGAWRSNASPVRQKEPMRPCPAQPGGLDGRQYCRLSRPRIR